MANEHDDVFYSLSVKDIQTVSKQEIGRALSEEEIKLVSDEATSRVNWYEAIADAIQEKIPDEQAR